MVAPFDDPWPLDLPCAWMEDVPPPCHRQRWTWYQEQHLLSAYRKREKLGLIAEDQGRTRLACCERLRLHGLLRFRNGSYWTVGSVRPRLYYQP